MVAARGAGSPGRSCWLDATGRDTALAAASALVLPSTGPEIFLLADRVTVLADHSKFDRRAVFEVAPLSRIDTLVTDTPPSEAMARALATAGVEVILPG